MTGLTRRYRRRGGHQIVAIDVVTITVAHGEAVAAVGESGSGKSTLVRCLSALEQLDGGGVRWPGTPVHTLGQEQLRSRCQHLQVIFPHPLASFDPVSPSSASFASRWRTSPSRRTRVGELLLCDEPVSSLDAELAASVADLLGRLRTELGLGLVFVTTTWDSCPGSPTGWWSWPQAAS